MICLKKVVWIAILSVLLFSLLLPFSLADDPLVTVKPVKTKVGPGEWAEFNITIYNPNRYEDDFKIEVGEESILWTALTQPTSAFVSGMKVEGGEVGSAKLLLKDINLPRSNTAPKRVDLRITSPGIGTVYSEMLRIYLLHSKEGDINEADLNVSLSVPRYIDPRNLYSFKVSIGNNKDRILKNIDIRLSSELFTKSSSVEIPPYGQKTIDFPITFDKSQKPAMDTLIVTISESDRILYRTTVPVEVVSYRIQFEEEKQTTEKFLKTEDSIKLTNTQNVEKQELYLVETSLLNYFITSTSPDSEFVKQNGKRYLAFNIRLDTGKSTTVVVTTNYRIIFYLLIFTAVVLFLYYMLRNPVMITKQCEVIKTKEGGLHEMKVILSIKNRSSKDFAGVKILDRIPSLASFERHHGQGTLHPEKIIRTEAGVVLRWETDIESLEERIITYHIISKLSIMGGLRLLPAIIKLHYDGKPITIRSNELSVSSL